MRNWLGWEREKDDNNQKVKPINQSIIKLENLTKSWAENDETLKPKLTVIVIWTPCYLGIIVGHKTVKWTINN